MERGANDPGIPMGFSMALAQNIDALRRFSGLPRNQQQRIIEHTRSIRSKDEMRVYVEKMFL